MAEKITLATLLAMYGADIAVVMSKVPEELADKMLDEWAAGIKAEAKAIRDDTNPPPLAGLYLVRAA